MPSVTVNGASGSYVVVNYDTAAYAALAQKLLTQQGNTGPNPTTIAQLITSSGSDTIAPGTVVTGIGTTNLSGGVGAVSLTDGSAATGQIVLSGAGTSLNFSTAMGTGTVVAGGGNDTIDLAANGWMAQVASGDKVTASGNDTIAPAGAAMITATGNDVVFGGVGGASITGGSGTLLYVASNGADTTAPVTSADTVAAGSGNLVAFTGPLGTMIALSSGNATVVADAGTTTAQANDTITGGSGFLTYFGAANANLTFSGGGNNNLFVAGSGNETLNASGATGSNVFYAGGGGPNSNDSITGGSGGANILWAGTGSDTLTGGGSGDVFGFAREPGAAGAHDTITDWNSTDQLALSGVSITSQAVDNGNLTMTLSDNVTVTFLGVSSDIGSGNIQNYG